MNDARTGVVDDFEAGFFSRPAHSQRLHNT